MTAVSTRDQRPANVDYYRRNREQEIFRVRARQAGTVAMLRELRQKPCLDCGGRFEPYQMDFDHRDPSTKLFNLTAGCAMLMPTSKILAEAAKCDVVCANCHRVRTQAAAGGFAARRTPGTSAYLDRKRQNWRDQAHVLTELRSVPCLDCGGTFSPYAMEFDHRDPSAKTHGVMSMVSRAGIAKILKEVAKCDIVCANCHRVRTYRRREATSSGRSSVG